MSRIPGPSGHSPLDPSDPNDQGGLWARITEDKARRLIRMDFGTKLTFLKLTIPGARHFIQAMRKWAASMPEGSNDTRLRFSVSPEPHISCVRIRFPAVVHFIRMTPADALAIAAEVESALGRLPS